MLTINAMTAADSVLVPVEPAFFSAYGLTELLKVYRNIKQRYNPQIEVEGILFTKDAPPGISVPRETKRMSGKHMEMRYGFLKLPFRRW